MKTIFIDDFHLEHWCDVMCADRRGWQSSNTAPRLIPFTFAKLKFNNWCRGSHYMIIIFHGDAQITNEPYTLWVHSRSMRKAEGRKTKRTHGTNWSLSFLVGDFAVSLFYMWLSHILTQFLYSEAICNSGNVHWELRQSHMQKAY